MGGCEYLLSLNAVAVEEFTIDEFEVGVIIDNEDDGGDTDEYTEEGFTKPNFNPSDNPNRGDTGDEDDFGNG